MRRADVALTCLSLVFAVFTAWTHYQPLIDLPQHASQIATWMRLADPSWPERSLYELNLGTPYLVAYGIARLFAPLLGVIGSLKLVLVLAVVGMGGALRKLALATGHSPWLALLGPPLAVGYSYYFGFVSYLLSIPLALCCWILALRHGERPSLRTGVALALLLLVTFGCHALGFALAVAGAGPLLLERGSWRTRLLALSSLVPTLVLATIWLPGVVSTGQRAGEYWGLGSERLSALPGYAVGMSSSDLPARLLGALLLVACVPLLGRPRGWLRALPLLVVVLGYLLLPMQLRSIGFVYPRLVVFLVPALLLAFAPRMSERAQKLAPVLPLLAACLWAALFFPRLLRFQRECTDFDAVLRDLPPGLAMRALVFARDTSAFPGVGAFLHFGAYYQVAKGGTQSYSFARNPTSVVRERPPGTPAIPNGFEWDPRRFIASVELPFFDCFLVRSKRDRAPQLFARQPDAVRLVSHHGQWWAYRKRAAGVAGQ